MPYVNSRGQIVNGRDWSWKSPMNGIFAFFNVVILFFTTMFGTLGLGSGLNSSSSSRGSSGGSGRGPSSGGPGSRGGRGGFGGFGPTPSMPPPGCGPCSGGGCGM